MFFINSLILIYDRYIGYYNVRKNRFTTVVMSEKKNHNMSFNKIIIFTHGLLQILYRQWIDGVISR